MRLTIEARDSGVPSLASTTVVMVNIIDYNDNDPKVSLYTSRNILSKIVFFEPYFLQIFSTNILSKGCILSSKNTYRQLPIISVPIIGASDYRR